MSRVLRSIAVLVIVAVYPISSRAQSCRLNSTTGAGATVNLVASYPLTGSTPAATASVDGNYYQLSNQLGIGPAPVVQTMYSNWMQTAGADNHPAYYGALFANPTNSAVTVTSVTVSAAVNHFTPPGVVGINPTTGWAGIDNRNLRWTGSISVPAHAAQGFIVADAPLNNAVNNTTRNVQLSATIVTSAGTFAAAPYTVTALTSSNQQASNAMVAFDTTGGGTFTPAMSVAGATSTAPVNLSVRVMETGNNAASAGIATGLQLTVTIPPRWSAVSVPTIAAPWSAGTLTITQPTATTAGQVVITTSQRIGPGASTAANSLVIRATAPTSSATNLFPFHLQLAGLSRGGRTISSFCDPVVQVLGNGTEAVNVEFLSASIGAGPVRQIDLATDFNVVNGSGTDTVRVDVFNNGTAGWDAIQTVTPGATNVSVPRTFTTDFEPYVDASNRMRIRFVSTGTASRTLRIDRVQWTMTLGYTVDNNRGSDTNPGNNARPFATIAKAASLLGASGAVYVEVGRSQSGTPYAGHVNVTAAGVASCPTLIQGVPLGGLPPVVRGVNPATDWGFDVLASQVIVTGFRIENMAVALAAENPFSGITFDGNSIQASTLGYGIVLNNYSTPTLPATASSGLRVTNCTIDGTGFQPLMGIYDAGAQGSLIDGNKILAVPNFGMYIDSAASPVIQRNIVTGNYFGVYLARTTGATLYDNSVDMNTYRGIHCEGSTGVVSRNNIISRNPIGFSADAASSVNSDYDDVWSNTNPYIGITAGANSLSADPLFIQTTTPSLATYYRLNTGSPCINRGVNVGLPYLGSAPDLGAVETQ